MARDSTTPGPKVPPGMTTTMSAPSSATRRLASTKAAPLVWVYGSSLQSAATVASSVSVSRWSRNGVELRVTHRMPRVPAAS